MLVGSNVVFSTEKRKGFIEKQIVGKISKIKGTHFETALYRVKFNREVERYGKLIGAIWATYQEIVEKTQSNKD